MANVHLLTVVPPVPDEKSWYRGAYLRLRESAESGQSPHRLVPQPEEADLILFAELQSPHLALNVRRHPYVRRYREKCFLFDSADRVIPFLPGIYASIEKSRYDRRRTRSGFYLSILENPYVEYDPAAVERDLLYSFIGSVDTAPVRADLAKLEHPRRHFIDTTGESARIWYSGTDEERRPFWRRYAESARRSQFVLCPRGVGPSSIRLFEMMKMGRAPVILSDEWVPPEGPSWETFSIRLAERDGPHLHSILEEREPEAVAMGIQARRAWEQWFSPAAAFNTVVDGCLDLKNGRRIPETWAHLTAYPQLAQRDIFRQYLRGWPLLRALKQQLPKP